MTDRRRNGLILLLVLGLLIGSGAAIAAKETRLGLDLKGGVELVYEGQPTPQQPKVTPEAIQRSLDIIRQRVDKLGVSEPEIQRSGSDQITVGLPDITNAKRAEEQVGSTAQLYFYDWEKNVLTANGTSFMDQEIPGQAATAVAPSFPLYKAVKIASKRPKKSYGTSKARYYLFSSKHKLITGPDESRADLRDDLNGKSFPSGSEVLVVQTGTVVVQAPKADGAPPDSPGPNRWYVLDDRPALSGKELKDPKQAFDNGPGGNGAPIVTFNFTDKGRQAFQSVTHRIAQRGFNLSANQHFAIVLDKEVVSTPYIDYQQNPGGINGSTGAEISGGFTIQSAQDLANLLQIGALPINLKLISQSQVSATLGQQALHQGLIAGLIGLGIVMLFLLAFYRVLGLIAVGALLIYAAYFYALIKLIPVTMTLPGIAGLILTIGVAADANIVIFERIKEEVRRGASVRQGILLGYKKGLSAIIDANAVTVLTAFILFVLATSGVKGFAFTLGIGTIVSLFTAVLATQAFLGTMGHTRLINHRTALGAGDHGHRWGIDFMGASRWFFSISGVILVVGALAIGGKGINFGIDFKSGTRIETGVKAGATDAQIRAVLVRDGLKSPEIQKIDNKELGANAYQISTANLEPSKVAKVKTDLDRAVGPTQNFNSTSIGPTFGETVARYAIIAIIASLLVISGYIALRFEWKYAVPVLIALAHDILITTGVYALTGREVTTSTIAALLTILGYSLYDTIIIFDRIRENVPRMPRAAFSQIVNRSLSEVLTRSLATTFSTVLPILALLLFGGGTLTDFAFALLVGVLSGAYSSIFIASPVLTHWKEREPGYMRRRARIMRESGGVVPAYAVVTVGGTPVDERPQAKRQRGLGARAGAGGIGLSLGGGAGEGEQVSEEEFEQMVGELGLEDGHGAARREQADGDRAPRRAAAATAARRGRARAEAREDSPGEPGGEVSPAPDEAENDGMLSADSGPRSRPREAPKPRAESKPKAASKSRRRNRRHGRPR